MKTSSFAIIAFCLVAAACESGPQTVTLDVGEKTRLKGTVVRDHPDGAEVVTSSSYEPGFIFREVDGAPVRGAAHFRDLLTAAEEREGGYMLSGFDPEMLNNYQQREAGR
jgi:hypothetical protein